MIHTLKHFFIPHEGNNYHPHILHTKRALLYSVVFVAMKLIVVSCAILLPLQVFMMPDVLQNEQNQIVRLTNEVRTKKGLPPLQASAQLYDSSQMKASDMAQKQYFDHVGPDGRGLKDYMHTVGYAYHYAGENLAVGFSDARDLVDAWIDSPTHYANLIDTDYTELGVGLELGEYMGVPTVYVAQHFGAPLEVAGIKEEETSLLEQDTATTTDNILEPSGLGEDIMPQIDPNAPNEGRDILPLITAQQSTDGQVATDLPSIVYRPDISRLYWREDGEKIIVTAKAYIVGDVASAVVRFGHYSITLTPSEQAYVYHGQITIFGTADELFKTITIPSISIRGSDESLVQENIDWDTVKIVGPNPIEKYTRAKSALGGITSIFDVSKNIYLGLIIFFSIALGLKIFIEFKKQHPHVIVQTLLLIGLLVILFEI